MVIRAFHPEATRASVARPDGVTPMRRLNAAGLFEARVPAGEPGVSNPLRQRRARVGAGGPVPVLAHARRTRPPPHRRRDAYPALARPRRPSHRAPGRRRHRLQRLGAERARRQRGQRRQLLGCADMADADCSAGRASGSCSRPGSVRGCATNSLSRVAMACASSRRTRWPGHRTIRPGPRASSSRASTAGATGRGCACGQRHRCSTRPSRSTRCTSGSWRRAPTAGCSTTARSPSRSRITAVDGIHPRRVAADHGASLRRFLGIPGHRVLRADRAPRLPDDFRVSSTSCTARHRVILDWVPAHFPRDGWALARFDGTPLYEHGDPRRGEHPDWGTTSSTTDATRCATSWWPTLYTGRRNSTSTGCASTRSPRCSTSTTRGNRARGCRTSMAAGRTSRRSRCFARSTTRCTRASRGCSPSPRRSTTWPGVTRSTASGGLGFDFKWNMGWMHDTLDYLHKDPVYRRYTHHQMTFGLMYAWSERFILPLSHDEVVHLKGSLLGKMSGDPWQRFANLRALYGWMWAHPGKKLLFMGGELADEREWAHDIRARLASARRPSTRRRAAV